MAITSSFLLLCSSFILVRAQAHGEVSRAGSRGGHGRSASRARHGVAVEIDADAGDDAEATSQLRRELDGLDATRSGRHGRLCSGRDSPYLSKKPCPFCTSTLPGRWVNQGPRDLSRSAVARMLVCGPSAPAAVSAAVLSAPAAPLTIVRTVLAEPAARRAVRPGPSPARRRLRRSYSPPIAVRSHRRRAAGYAAPPGRATPSPRCMKTGRVHVAEYHRRMSHLHQSSVPPRARTLTMEHTVGAQDAIEGGGR